MMKDRSRLYFHQHFPGLFLTKQALKPKVIERRRTASQCSQSNEVPGNALERIIRRKYNEIDTTLKDLGDQWLEFKMQDTIQNPLPKERQFRFRKLLAEALPQRKVVLLAEIPRTGLLKEDSERVAARAKILSDAGVDALVVQTDSDVTDTGLQDLFNVVRSVPEIPVFQRDWFIHPLQIIEAKESGVAGVLGIICQVSRSGVPVLNSFSGAIGLDSPVEVVNQMELDGVLEKQIPMVAINCGIRLKLSGYTKDLVSALLPSVPPSCASIVGVSDVDAARTAALAGASAVFLKASMLEATCDDLSLCKGLVQEILDAVSK